MSGEEEPHEYSASLSVFSETIPLADLTTALGQPSDGYDRGDLVSSRNPDGARRTQAAWILESRGGRLRPLEEQIDELLVYAEGRRAALAAVAPGIRARIFCGVFSGEDAQGGFTLEPETLRRLAALDLPVVFDLY